MSELRLHLSLKRRLLVECQIQCEEDLHVGIGRGETTVTAADLPVQRDSRGSPFIPGSSLRGAFRSHIHRLLTSLEASEDEVTKKDLLGEEHVTMNEGEEREFVEATGEKKNALFEKLGVIQMLFGASGFASPLRFTDARLMNGGEIRRRVHVSIDLGTDRVRKGALADLESVVGGSTFSFIMVFDELSDKHMRVANKVFYTWLKGLAINDGVEMFLGGWKSRGYGLCKVKISSIKEYTPRKLVLGDAVETYATQQLATFLDSVLAELQGAR